MWSGVSSTPAPVPPAGFLNLSAVSWQIRACGLVSCRYRPWVTSPFRASPRRDRAPVSGSPAPLRSSPRTLRALTRPFHRGFRRRPPHRWGSCRYPPAATDHLSARRPWLACLPVTTGPRAAGSRPTTRIIRFEASFPLQSCAAEPQRVSPMGAALLSWAFRPSRAFSTRPLDPLADPPHPRSAARTAHDCSHTARDFRDLATPGSGEPGQAPALRGCLASSIGGHRSSVDRAVPPSRRQSFSRGLDSREGDLARPWPSELRSERTAASPPPKRRRQLSWGS